jgi:PAS domain S-box-containing protein
MVQEAIVAAIPRAAGAFALGVSGLAAVTAVSLWLGFDSGPAAFLYLIVITLLSLVSGFLPAFCLSILAVTALNFFFVPPTFSLSVPSVLDILELAGFLTVATVTTQLVSRATRAAREAEARARLLDLTHDAVIGFDLNRRITYWNHGAEKLYGWPAAEVIGSSADLLQAELPGPSDDDIAVALAQTGIWQGEAVHKTRDGRRVVVDGRIVLERDASGAPVAVLATTNDVTDRRAAEENLRNAQEALAHATRLTTLGEVSASIAHEINQPLTAIVNNANASLVLLSDAQPNLEEVRAALTDVVNDAERASAIIARIRLMSRRAAPQQAPCRIDAIIADVAALAVRMSALHGVPIVNEVPHDLPTVLGDRVQLAQVILEPRGERRSIIEAHGGRLWAEPNDERGAVFAFRLPAAQPGAET